MSDNTDVKNASGATVTVRSKDVGAGVQAWHQVPLGVDNLPLENAEGTLLASAARTADGTSSDQTNNGKRALLFVIKITINAGSAAQLTPRLEWKNPLTGDYNAIWTAAAAIAAVGTYLYRIEAGAADLTAFQETVDCPVPRTFRLVVGAADASPATYSAAYALMV